MSRSILTTRRHVDSVIKSKYSDPERKKDELRELRQQLTKKRRIKYWAKQPSVAATLPPLEAEGIPIIVKDESPYAHYPASVEDIRGLLARLPKGMSNGLGSIVLRLGAEVQESYKEEGDEPDPFTGRISYKKFFNVYCGKIIALCNYDEAKIEIFAYVYDRATLPDPEIWECYMRLYLLSVLTHEVAHHFDNFNRVARGRWIGNKNAEEFADDYQYKLLYDYVVPFWEEAYPVEVAALYNWIEKYTGLKQPLHLLIGTLPIPDAEESIYAAQIFNTDSAFEEFVEAVYAGNDLIESLLYLGVWLHFASQFRVALEIFDQVLLREPKIVKALTEKAHTLTYLKDYEQAKIIALKALELDSTSIEARAILCNVYEALEDWAKMLEAANSGLSFAAGSWRYNSFIADRANAKIGLGDLDGAKADAEILIQGSSGDVYSANQILAKIELSTKTGKTES